MSPLEIISRLCDVTENLSTIVKKQQTIIEQSKIEEAVRVELRQEVVASNTTGIVESVTQFQKDAVIDEYTQQLIEEGLI